MPLAVAGLVMRAGMLLLLIRIGPTDSTHPVRGCHDGAAHCFRMRGAGLHRLTCRVALDARDTIAGGCLLP